LSAEARYSVFFNFPVSNYRLKIELLAGASTKHRAVAKIIDAFHEIFEVKLPISDLFTCLFIYLPQFMGNIFVNQIVNFDPIKGSLKIDCEGIIQEIACGRSGKWYVVILNVVFVLLNQPLSVHFVVAYWLFSEK